MQKQGPVVDLGLAMRNISDHTREVCKIWKQLGFFDREFDFDFVVVEKS